MRRLEVDTLQTKLSEEDLFSEIALPAGVATVSPPFGVGRNQGFVSHGAAAADAGLTPGRLPSMEDPVSA